MCALAKTSQLLSFIANNRIVPFSSSTDADCGAVEKKTTPALDTCSRFRTNEHRAICKGTQAGAAGRPVCAKLLDLGKARRGKARRCPEGEADAADSARGSGEGSRCSRALWPPEAGGGSRYEEHIAARVSARFLQRDCAGS